MRHLWSLLFVFLVVAAVRLPVRAQEDEESPFRPGLVATYTSGGASASRTDEVVAFDWQDGAPDPRLLAGNFTAEWSGRLLTQTKGAYRLLCYVQGEVEVKLAGQTVISGKAEQPRWLSSQTMEWGFDRHELGITYRKVGPRAQLALYWSGPDFRLEPVGERFLMHERERSPSAAFERGRQLAAVLRCGACHQGEGTKITPAPALDRLTGNVQEQWLVHWLAPHQAIVGKQPLRRMPDLGIAQGEAAAIAAWLLREPAVKAEQKKAEQKEAKATKEDSKKAKKGKGDEKPKPSAAEGERLVLTRGCLACHQYGELGESGLFGGGVLRLDFSKRSPDFFVRWLEDPSAINRSHRMPIFSFNRDELESLKLWIQEAYLSYSLVYPSIEPANRSAVVRNGENHVATFRCANCHVVSREKNELAAAFRPPLTAVSDWLRACSGEPSREKGQPGYRLASEDQKSLKAYYSQPRPGEGKLSPQARGRDLLVQLNCLACHQREGIDRVASALPARLQDKLTAVAEAHDELAALVPAMTPPALNSVGDKLHDAALVESIRRKGPAHRPYLLVQMPRFNLTDEQLGHLTAYVTATDRIPPGREGEAPAEPPTGSKLAALAAAGPRLVTADGLACTSCHQVGSVLPSKAPLNARGPDVSMLEKRIRHEWFDRWCDNPARIVPRMEMPSVKVPVRGVLNEKIDDQLAAVWHILNTPGFEPPEPNPVRVLRLSGVPEKNERPIVIHDVFKDGDKTYLYPLVIGLPNRHNLLFDLETNRLAAWWLGDTARQRTKGKSWFWETGGKSIADFGLDGSELSLVVDGKEQLPIAKSQFVAELNEYSTGLAPTFLSEGRLTFPTTRIVANQQATEIETNWRQSFGAYVGDSLHVANGFTRHISLSGPESVSHVRLRIVGPQVARNCKWDENKRVLSLPGASGITIHIQSPATWNSDGKVTAETHNQANAPAGRQWSTGFMLSYSESLPVDQYLADPPPALPVAAAELEIAPGFTATRLPLPDDIMPAGLSWNEQGSLYFATLKGQVYWAADSQIYALEGKLSLVADGLATPYGIQAHKDYVDVSAKDGVLRLMDFDEQSRADRVQRVVVGWGCTDDYHDWAVGLVPGAGSEYFVALPCQQDARNEPAAALRGKILRVGPQQSFSLFLPKRESQLEVISSGHRFPMGMAMNREGELFVTDNQGNYNPFNELNHVKKGAHFGFINALEKEKGYQPPPLTEPAINIPHPWTRSVNGICFLDTPEGLGRVGSAHQDINQAEKVGTAHPTLYGPLEGHLVGCEYDTRRLIRMSLQKVNGEYQGCAYPLSIPPADVEKGLLGPIVCAIKPTTGELYVGEIRDSGWGASNNIGQIVKIKIEPEKLPCGIAEVRATATGFTIDFFQPVDSKLAADVASYSISSYRRESTPAYGGPDIDRRDEKISSATLSADGKRVTLVLPELRARHVYELRLKNLAPGGGVFHPDEAHYTLKQVPR